MTIRFVRTHPKATIPLRATSGSAGYDLCACLEGPVTIAPGETKLISTGLCMELPGPDVAALIYARSGLAIKKGIIPANCVGVVDSDYRGEVCVGLRNASREQFVVEHGDRIAQLVLTPVLHAQFEEADDLAETRRGAGGFGSTGVGAKEK